MKKFLNVFSDYYLTFCIYAFIGWIYEVVWMWFVVPPFHFVNRGVLFGPFLPIYGFGMLLLLVILDEFMKKKHKLKEPIYLIGSTIIITTFVYTTIIEYTTPKIYHVIDYLKEYGLGLLMANLIAVIIVYLLVNKTRSKQLKNIDVTIVLVFLSIWIITTTLEYVSHFVADTAFNITLWNYSKDFLNINTRVNWDASRNFAIGGTLLLYVVQPLVNKLSKRLTKHDKLVITSVIGIPMLLDFILNVLLKGILK